MCLVVDGLSLVLKMEKVEYNMETIGYNMEVVCTKMGAVLTHIYIYIYIYTVVDILLIGIVFIPNCFVVALIHCSGCIDRRHPATALLRLCLPLLLRMLLWLLLVKELGGVGWLLCGAGVAT